jgi:TonB family protein
MRTNSLIDSFHTERAIDMKLHLKPVLLIFFFVFSINTHLYAQGNNEPRLDNVVVTLAVTPTYPLTALHTHTSGEAVIEVKIGSDGSVTSAKEISGSPLLVGGAKSTARRWKFAPATGGKTIRTVRLTFVYHLVPRDASVEDLVAVFKPPYHVEITHILPDESPLP